MILGRPQKIQVGDRSDHLVVLRFEVVADKRHATCRCDCGNTITVRYESLRRKTNSCGCKPGPNWKGCGDLSASYYGSIKKGAGVRGIDFDVTMSDLWQLLVDQNHRCNLSGLPIHLGSRTSDRHTASVDRIDNTKGYVLGNIQWVHKDINLMKHQYDQTYFIDLCKRVASNQSGTRLPDPPAPTIKPQRGRKLPNYARKGWNVHRPKLSVESILTDIDKYFSIHGKYPSCTDCNPVPDKPEESWSNYDQNLRRGKRGLPGKSSLFQVITQFRQR